MGGKYTLGKRKVFCLLVCFVMFYALFTSNVCGSTQIQISIGSYGAITSTAPPSNIQILRQTYASWSYSTQQVTSNFDLIIGHWDIVNSLLLPPKEARSDFKSLLYFNSLYRYTDAYNDPPGSFSMFQNNNWLLKDINGNYVNSGAEYLLDFGNPAVWTWYANWLASYVNDPNHPLDGVQMDNFCFDKGGAFYYSPTQNIINPRTGSLWTDAEVLNAYIGFASTIKNTLGPEKIVLCNGIYNGNSNKFNPTIFEQIITQTGVDGFMSEGWFGNSLSLSWISESDWVNNVNLAVWIQDNLLAVKSHGMFIPVTGCASTNPDYGPGSLNGLATSNQYTTFVYASMLLAAKYSGNYLFFGTTDTFSQNLFTIDIGDPISNYSLISSTHVYYRDFSNGKVLVNPTASSYQVSVGSGYIDATSGVSVSSQVTIPAHSGLILKK